jgi:excisionase family DNA binding protein
MARHRKKQPQETTSIEDAAKRLNIGRNQAYQAARDDKLPIPVIRIGRRLLIPTAALDRLLNGESSPQSA